MNILTRQTIYPLRNVPNILCFQHVRNGVQYPREECSGGCGDTLSPSMVESVSYRDMFITGSGWSINDKIIYVSPEHICQELFDHRGFLGTSPHDCIILTAQQECYGHYAESEIKGVWLVLDANLLLKNELTRTCTV